MQPSRKTSAPGGMARGRAAMSESEDPKSENPMPASAGLFEAPLPVETSDAMQ
ncbi:MAG: hypothetical protein ACE5EQ_00320 [Phycisphaerae bacterium]